MRLPSARSVIFSLVIVVLAVGFLELLSWCLLFVFDGEIFSYWRLQSERLLLSDGPVETALSKESWRVPLHLEEQVLHPYVGFVFDPEGSAADRMRAEWGWQISDLGFPGDRRQTLPPPENALIIGIFGGSVANIQAVNAYLLEAALAGRRDFAGRPIVVHGAAMPGFKQPQQLMALNWLLGIGQDFDVIVNLDGFNEIVLPTTENLPHDVDLSYPLGWRQRAAGTVDPLVTARAGEIAYGRRKRAATAARFSRLPWRVSVTANLVWRMLDRRLHHDVTAATVDLEDLPSRQRTMLTHGPRRNREGKSAPLGEMVDLWQRCSLLMGQLCSGAGIDYYHMLQPNQYVPDSKSLTSRELRQAFDPDHRYRQAVVDGYPLLRAAGRQLEQMGIRFTDLTMLFADVEQSVYFDTCCHLNLLGNEMLAQAIADEIAAEKDQ